MTNDNQTSIRPAKSQFNPRQRREIRGINPVLPSRIDYQFETRRPLVCLAFIAPILFVYELGAIILGDQGVRNGVDLWLSSLFGWLGPAADVMLPLITIGTLLAMHHGRNDRWSIRPSVFPGMLLESFGLALILLWAAKAHHMFFLDYAQTPPANLLMKLAETDLPFGWSSIVTFFGAGLYEELAFRLLLLPLLILAAQRAGLSGWLSTALGVAITSLLFAALHYDFINPGGGPFELPTFAVRTLASLVFCLVFLLRGFGIAVGTHIAYDLLTQV